MRRILTLARRLLLLFGAFILVAAALLLFSLTMRIGDWRSGEIPVPPLTLAEGRPFAEKPMRLWIDTDAACGHGPRTDPDDCLAILLLAQARDDIEIVGISTVFGNAPLPVTDRTTRELVARLEAHGMTSAPVFRGAADPGDAPKGQPTPAPDELRAALEQGPLVILALGPVTNIVAALRDRPDLQANVARVVAVMGRRWGHLFHPVEGGTAGSFLGHGPVFRDFNFAKDEASAAALIAMGLPVTLVPYEAARDMMIDGATLDRMIAAGGPAVWVAQRSRAWLAYWREDIGRDGFYPFDLVAAAYLMEPPLLRCAEVRVAVGEDAGLLGWLGRRGLFALSPEERVSDQIVSGDAAYCPEASERLGGWLAGRFSEPRD